MQFSRVSCHNYSNERNKIFRVIIIICYNLSYFYVLEWELVYCWWFNVYSCSCEPYPQECSTDKFKLGSVLIFFFHVFSTLRFTRFVNISMNYSTEIKIVIHTHSHTNTLHSLHIWFGRNHSPTQKKKKKVPNSEKALWSSQKHSAPVNTLIKLKPFPFVSIFQCINISIYLYVYISFNCLIF